MNIDGIEYPIVIEDYNSSGIRDLSKSIGATHMRKIGSGFCSGHDGEADYHVSFFAFLHPREGWEIRVADTNGDPVWEEEDQQGFLELAADCGVDLS